MNIQGTMEGEKEREGEREGERERGGGGSRDGYDRGTGPKR